MLLPHASHAAAIIIASVALVAHAAAGEIGAEYLCCACLVLLSSCPALTPLMLVMLIMPLQARLARSTLAADAPAPAAPAHAATYSAVLQARLARSMRSGGQRSSRLTT